MDMTELQVRALRSLVQPLAAGFALSMKPKHLSWVEVRKVLDAILDACDEAKSAGKDVRVTVIPDPTLTRKTRKKKSKRRSSPRPGEGTPSDEPATPGSTP